MSIGLALGIRVGGLHGVSAGSGGSAFTFVDANNAAGEPAVVTKPTGTVDGDLLIGICASLGTITQPGGWTENEEQSVGGVFFSSSWKVASAEGASFSFSGTSSSVAIVAAFRGNHASPFDIDGYATGSDTTPTGPSITTTVNNDLLIWSILATSSVTVLVPSGYTVPTDGNVLLGGSVPLVLSYKLNAGVAGATGTAIGGLGSATSYGVLHSAFKKA